VTIASRRTLTEIVAATLSQIQTAFGRLLYISRSFDDEAGRYTHAGWTLSHDAAKIDAELRAAHKAAFAEWLSMSLQHQHADLNTWLDGLDRTRVLSAWIIAEPWMRLIPPSAHDAEHALFLSNFRMLLGLLKSGQETANCSTSPQDATRCDSTQPRRSAAR
jgi:hypothetical protein